MESRATLPRLCVELQIQIVEQLSSKADLKALCLTCSMLKAVAVPILYRNIILFPRDLSRPPTTRKSKRRPDKAVLIKRVPASENPGLKHVRRLAMMGLGPRYRPRIHWADLYDLLQALPSDCLEECFLETMEGVPPEIMALIRTRQMRLQNYQSHNTGYAFITDAIPTVKQLHLITSVQLFISNEEQCSTAQHILGLARNIQRLSLNINIGSMKYHNRCANQRGELQSYPAVIKRISGHDSVTGGATPLKLRLRELILDDLPIGQCCRVLLEMVHPELLEVVETKACDDAYTLYSHLAGTGNARALRSIANSNSRGLYQDMPEGLEQLLENATGIETIRSTERDQRETPPPCSWAAVQLHWATLRVLEIDHKQSVCNTSNTEGLEAFSQMCVHCTSLQELSTALPEPEWRQRFISALKALTALRTLRIFYYLPDGVLGIAVHPKGPQDKPNLNALTLAAHLQPVVDEVFAALSDPCSHFSALHIEIRKAQVRTWGEEEFVMSFGYLRGQVKTNGRLEHASIPMAPHLLRHHCSAAAVLDDDQPPL